MIDLECWLKKLIALQKCREMPINDNSIFRIEMETKDELFII